MAEAGSDEALGGAEVEDLAEEPLDVGRFGAVIGGVVEAGDLNPPGVAGPDLRVEQAHVAADVLHLGVQLHDLPRRERDAQAVAHGQVVALAHPLDGDAEGPGPILVEGQVVGVLALEAKPGEARPALFEHHGVMVELVPSLEMDPAAAFGVTRIPRVSA